MLLNMLNDLAEATKASDGKKAGAVFTACVTLIFFFRPTPYGFRQVVQHVSNHVACEINHTACVTLNLG